MTIKPRIQDVLWMAAGAGLLLIVMLLILHFQIGQDPASPFASKTRRLELVAQMQLGLASASEAEKSAVLAITDEDSRKFADQARGATTQVEQERAELAQLLAATDNQNERDMLAQFAEAFEEFKQVDKDLLALAVKNTNVKASSLTYGPATSHLNEMDAALARLPTDNPNVVRLVDDARISTWRLWSLIPPHIAEESDQKMTEMESKMDKEERQVLQSLDGLAAMGALKGNADLSTAGKCYADLRQVKQEILKLSRENTNVQSLSTSLNHKRKVMLACQASLAALQQAIQAEPIPGAPHGKFG